MTIISISPATLNLAEALNAFTAAEAELQTAVADLQIAKDWRDAVSSALRPDYKKPAHESAVLGDVIVTAADLHAARNAQSRATRAWSKSEVALTAAREALEAAKAAQPESHECQPDVVEPISNVLESDLMRGLDFCTSQIIGLGHVPVADLGSRVAYIIMDEVLVNGDRTPVIYSVAREAAVRLHGNDLDRRGAENLACYILQSAACIARGETVADIDGVRSLLNLCLYTPSAMRAYGPEWGSENRYEDVRHLVLDLIHIAGFVLWASENKDEVAYIKDNPTNHHNHCINNRFTDPELQTLRSLAYIVDWLAPSTLSDCSLFREAA